MKINILICTDNDEVLVNETVDNLDDAKFLIAGFEYEYKEDKDE